MSQFVKFFAMVLAAMLVATGCGPGIGDECPQGFYTTSGGCVPSDADQVDVAGDDTTDVAPAVCEIDDDCDDDNPCTTDFCWGGYCKTRPVDLEPWGGAVACDDDNPCTKDDRCEGGKCGGTLLTLFEVLKIQYWAIDPTPDNGVSEIPQTNWGECWGEPEVMVAESGFKYCDAPFNEGVPCADITVVGTTDYFAGPNGVHEQNSFSSNVKWWSTWRKLFTGVCIEFPEDAYVNAGLDIGCVAVAPRCTAVRDSGEQCQIDSVPEFSNYKYLVNGPDTNQPQKMCFDYARKEHVFCNQAFCDGLPGCNDELYCRVQTLPQGTRCEDGDLATQEDVCNGRGVCGAKSLEGEPCYNDSYCGDGSACTTDKCEQGFCVSSEICDDDDPKTIDTCHEVHWDSWWGDDDPAHVSQQPTCEYTKW